MKRRIGTLICIVFAAMLLVSCTNGKKPSFMGYEWKMSSEEIRQAADLSGGKVLGGDDPVYDPLTVIYDHPEDFPADKLILYMPLLEGALHYINGNILIVSDAPDEVDGKVERIKEYFDSIYGQGYQPEQRYTCVDEPTHIESGYDRFYDWEGASLNMLVKTVTAGELAAQDIGLVFERFTMQRLAETDGIDLTSIPPDILLTAVSFFVNL